jgi:hypothetical protein
MDGETFGSGVYGGDVRIATGALASIQRALAYTDTDLGRPFGGRSGGGGRWSGRARAGRGRSHRRGRLPRLFHRRELILRLSILSFLLIQQIVFFVLVKQQVVAHILSHFVVDSICLFSHEVFAVGWVGVTGGRKGTRGGGVWCGGAICEQGAMV